MESMYDSDESWEPPEHASDQTQGCSSDEWETPGHSSKGTQGFNSDCEGDHGDAVACKSEDFHDAMNDFQPSFA